MKNTSPPVELPELSSEAVTQRMEALGVVDETIEACRTVTLRTRHAPGTIVDDRGIEELPRIDEGHEDSVGPELRIKELLGEGGMGRVEAAEQVSVGRDVAVKRLKEASSPEKYEGLLREGWTTGVLEHPNIVPVYGIGRDRSGEPMILMKKIAGVGWHEIIAQSQRAPEVFDAADIWDLHVQIAMQVCNAVDYAHGRDIVHRDIKPENVMLGSFGEVYLLDWGIAVSVADEESSRFADADAVEMPEGTVAYMAPEMVDPEPGKLGAHTDVFLIGASLYEGLTGHPPYSGATVYQMLIDAHRCEPPEFGADVPRQLAAICRRAMARDPRNRYPSVRALREALVEFRNNRDIRRLIRKGEERLDEVGEWFRRHRSGEEVDDADLYGAFGQARFAFEQAQKLSPGARRAHVAIQCGLEWMAEWELWNDAPEAASLMVAELPEPRPELEHRIERLEHEIAGRKDRYEQLRRLRYELNLEVGRRGRIGVVAAMAAVIAAVSVAATALAGAGVVERSHWSHFSAAAVTTLVLGLGWWVGRDGHLENLANEKFMGAAAVLAGGATIHRGLMWLHDVPLEQGLVLEAHWYVLGAAITSVAFGRRYLVAGAILWSVALIGVIWSTAVFWVFPVALVAVAGWLAWLWSSGAERVTPAAGHGRRVG